MNKSEKLKEDILSGFIHPEKIEKAPEGFTENVMTRIHIENLSPVIPNKYFYNIKVPLISGLVTVALIISALLLPETDKNSMFIPFLNRLSNFHVGLPDINLNKFVDFALPGWMIYISTGMFMLLIFDMALNTFFKRQRK